MVIFEFIPYEAILHLVVNFPEFPDKYTEEEKQTLYYQLKGLAKVLEWDFKYLMAFIRILLTGCNVGFCLFSTINLIPRQERLRRLLAGGYENLRKAT